MLYFLDYCHLQRRVSHGFKNTVEIHCTNKILGCMGTLCATCARHTVQPVALCHCILKLIRKRRLLFQLFLFIFSVFRYWHDVSPWARDVATAINLWRVTHRNYFARVLGAFSKAKLKPPEKCWGCFSQTLFASFLAAFEDLPCLSRQLHLLMLGCPGQFHNLPVEDLTFAATFVPSRTSSF